MHRKLNCWEFKHCGREPGGANAQSLGVCPAATCTEADCIHGGTNAGRVCWAIAGTLCFGEAMGTFAAKFGDCLQCDFYGRVVREEGDQCVSVARLLNSVAAHAAKATETRCPARPSAGAARQSGTTR